MRLTSHFRSYFFRGLTVLLPTILTIWIFVWGFNFIQSNISEPINKGIAWLDLRFEGGDWSDESLRDEKISLWTDTWRSIAGFIIALIAVCIVGMIFASVVGRTFWRYIEKLIMNAPFIRGVYPYIKQITDFLLAQGRQEKLFLRVVGVEYPRKGIWSIGMVTGNGLPKLVNNFRKDYLTILIPTSPTPFTGFVIMVPEKETIELDITVEEALRFTISGGVITPATPLDKYDSTMLPKTEDESSEEKEEQ